MTAQTVTNRRLPAPMRMLRQLLACLRTSGNRLEYDVVDRQIAREEQALKEAAQESRAIEERIAQARAAVHAALNDKKSPNVIDAREGRALARRLLGADLVAKSHVRSLEALS